MNVLFKYSLYVVWTEHFPYTAYSAILKEEDVFLLKTVPWLFPSWCFISHSKLSAFTKVFAISQIMFHCFLLFPSLFSYGKIYGHISQCFTAKPLGAISGGVSDLLLWTPTPLFITVCDTNPSSVCTDMSMSSVGDGFFGDCCNISFWKGTKVCNRDPCGLDEWLPGTRHR
jgi:hypothetical protein